VKTLTRSTAKVKCYEISLTKLHPAIGEEAEIYIKVKSSDDYICEVCFEEKEILDLLDYKDVYTVTHYSNSDLKSLCEERGLKVLDGKFEEDDFIRIWMEENDFILVSKELLESVVKDADILKQLLED
jgi:hypothetical protein